MSAHLFRCELCLAWQRTRVQRRLVLIGLGCIYIHQGFNEEARPFIYVVNCFVKSHCLFLTTNAFHPYAG